MALLKRFKLFVTSFSENEMLVTLIFIKILHILKDH